MNPPPLRYNYPCMRNTVQEVSGQDPLALEEKGQPSSEEYVLCESSQK